MVLNLYMIKGLPFNPILSCLKKIGPDVVSLMMKPVMMITGNNIIRAIRENAMSKMRFSDNCQSGIRSGYIWIRGA